VLEVYSVLTGVSIWQAIQISKKRQNTMVAETAASDVKGMRKDGLRRAPDDAARSGHAKKHPAAH
jgi:hypothetical protein